MDPFWRNYYRALYKDGNKTLSDINIQSESLVNESVAGPGGAGNIRKQHLKQKHTEPSKALKNMQNFLGFT